MLIKTFLKKYSSWQYIDVLMYWLKMYWSKRILNNRRFFHQDNLTLRNVRHQPANIYLLKVNNRNTRKRTWTMSKVNNKITRMTSMMSLWCFHCSLWIHFTPFFTVFIGDSEQVSLSWAVFSLRKDFPLKIQKTFTFRKIKWRDLNVSSEVLIIGSSYVLKNLH